MMIDQNSQGHGNIQIVGDNSRITIGGGLTKGLTKLIEVLAEYFRDKNSAANIVRQAIATEKVKTISLKEEIKRTELLTMSATGHLPGNIPSEDIDILRIMIGRERRHQDNIDKIVKFAANCLIDADDADVDDEMPDSDWVDQFFEYCKTTSSKKMQKLWGYILSQKIRSPKIGKPLTLHCLKMLNQENALAFEKLCNMALVTPDKVFVLKDMTEEFEYGDLLELENIGLINADQNIWFYTRTPQDRYPRHGNTTIELAEIKKQINPSIAVIPFTTSGIELFDLIKGIKFSDKDYLQGIIKIFKQFGVFMSIKTTAAKNA